MDLGPLRPYTWAVLLGLFVPLSWILEVMLGPAAIVFARTFGQSGTDGGVAASTTETVTIDCASASRSC